MSLGAFSLWTYELLPLSFKVQNVALVSVSVFIVWLFSLRGRVNEEYYLVILKCLLETVHENDWHYWKKKIL